MNFKRSILLICIIGFLLETSTIPKVNATHGTQDSTQCKKKANKQYIRNEHIKKDKDTTQLENNSDLDVDSSDKSNQSSAEGDEHKGTPTISEIHIVLDKPKKENTVKKSVEELNSEKQNSTENTHASLPSISEYIEKYPIENELKHKRRHTTLANQEMKTSEEESKQETHNASNSASSINASTSESEPNNKHAHAHKQKHMKKGKSKANVKDHRETNEGNEETIYTIAEEIIDQLDALLFDDSDNDKNNNNERDVTKRKSQTDINDLSKTVHGTKKDSSGNDKDVEELKNKISNAEISEEILDIEPKIEKEFYHPLGTSRTEEQSVKDVKETNKGFIDAATIDKLLSNGKTQKVDAMNATAGSGFSVSAAEETHSSFLQKEGSDMDESILNENANSENDDSEDENSENGDSEDAINNEEPVVTSIENEKINEDTNLASFEMEEDIDEHNKSKNVEDSSTRKEKKLIRNARKVYKLNLFNCDYINDWDFTKEYVDEQGALVKLSGYVFQNTLNSNSMPTMNITEWKLKGACDYEKYVCGALPYFENIYQKGDRVIFDGKIFEALNDTATSPKTDDGTWVDKTNECFDS